MSESYIERDHVALPLQDWYLDYSYELVQRLTNLSVSDVFRSHSTYQVSLGYAARGSHWKFLKQLAQTGLQITTSNLCGDRNICTDLVKLLQESDFDSVKDLLDTNRDLLKARSGNSLITALLYHSCTLECLEFVIDLQKEVNEFEYKDAVNVHDWHGFTPLIAAVLTGNVPCVQRLLERGANVDLPCSVLGIELKPEIGISYIEENVWFKENIFFGQSKTALMYAACLDNLECIKILLKFNPDLKWICFKGMNALSYAAISTNFQCLDLLLKTSLKVVGYGRTVDNRSVSDKYNITSPKFVLSLSEVSFDFSDNKNESLKQEIKVSQTNTSRFSKPDKLSRQRKGGQLSKDMIRKKLSLRDKCYFPRDESFEKTLYEVALPYAVIGGDFQCVELLLNHCVNLDSTISSSKTALMLAAEEGKDDLVQLLLKNWANINISLGSSDKETALMLASKNGHVKCLKLLLQSDARIDDVSISRETALAYACRYGRKDCVELLVEHKANIEVQNEKRQTPLIIAASNGKYDCTEKLLEFNAKIDEKDVYEMSAPMYAVENGHTKCLEVFLRFLIKREGLEKMEQAACNVTDTDLSKVPPNIEQVKTSTTLAEELLPMAIACGNDKCVELLLPHCMDFGRVKKVGDKSALMLCCERGNLDLVKEMVKRCVNINAGSRATALTCAVKAGKYECLKLLLEYGAKPDIEIHRGLTAAIIAAKDGNETCLKLLLEHGADPNHFSKCGKSALKSAAINKRSECLKLLIKHGANVNQKSNVRLCDKQQFGNDFSAIMCAVLSENNLNCLKILTDAGGKVDIVDFYTNKTKPHLNWSLKFLERPENLKILLEEGKLVMSRELLPHEENFGRDLDTKSKFLSIKLLLECDVFDWKYWMCLETFEKLLLLAVGVGVFPKKIFYKGDMYSPLLYAFLNNKQIAVRYMLCNLYFSIDDYRVLTSDTAFTTKLMNKIKSSSLSSLLLKLTLQPWSIQTLCLLTISTALSHNGSPKERSSQVDSLPIPEKFKTLLKFNGSYSRICIHEWNRIGNDDAMLKPLKKEYCFPDELSQCDEDCLKCGGFGFRSYGSDGSSDRSSDRSSHRSSDRSSHRSSDRSSDRSSNNSSDRSRDSSHDRSSDYS